MSAQPAYNAPPTSTLAIVSLVSGILSWIVVPVVGGIAAVICGHLARREIRDARGALGGDGLAVGGLILGYLHLALLALGVLAVVLFLGGFAALLAYAN
ncbi:MAG TPA: DUF4190 domain-containing protein [Lysobacter sp.]